MSTNLIKPIHTLVAFCVALAALAGTVGTSLSGLNGVMDPKTSQVVVAILVAVAGIATAVAAAGSTVLKAFGDESVVSVQVPKTALVDDVATAAKTDNKTLLEQEIEKTLSKASGASTNTPAVSNPTPPPITAL